MKMRTTALSGHVGAVGRDKKRPPTAVRRFLETGPEGGWKSLSRRQPLPAYSGQDRLTNRWNGGR